MGEPRLSNIIIGVLLISVFTTAFMLFLGAGADKYGLTDYNPETFIAYNDSSAEALATQQQVQEETNTLGASPGDNDFDIFGSLFSSSWTAIKSTDDSIDTIASITVTGTDELANTGAPSNFLAVLKTNIIGIVGIIFVIAILLHFIAKSNRL